MRRKIIFRADGNSEIGLGHIMRCLALAEMLEGDFDMSFAIQNPDEKIEKLIHETGINIVIKLPQVSDYQEDIINEEMNRIWGDSPSEWDKQ